MEIQKTIKAKKASMSTEVSRYNKSLVNPRTRIVVTFSSVLAYILIFISLKYTYGQGMAISAIIPIVVVGWFYGFAWGLCAGLLSFPANMLMYRIVGVDWFIGMVPSPGAIPGTLALIFIGAIIGRIHDLNTQIKKHLDKLDELVKQKTEELQESVKGVKGAVEYLDNIIESSVDCITVSDSTGNITRANKSFLELLGYKENEVIGRHTTEFPPIKMGTYESTTGELVKINEEFFNKAKPMIEKLFEEGRIENRESYLVRKDKKIVPVDENIVILYNEEGDVSGSVGIIRDVTKRKIAEKEIIEAKGYLDNAIENSLDAIIFSDNKGCISIANQSFLRLIGGSEQEIIGKHMAEFSPMEKGTYESTMGESVQLGKEYLDDVSTFVSRLVEVGKIINYENYLIRKDRKLVPVEENIALLYNEKKERIGAIGVIRDITDRRKAEKEIIEARNFLENVFNTTADGIMVTDTQGCIMRVNKAMGQMLGFREDELIGKYTSELGMQSEESEKANAVMLEQLFEKGFVNNYETVWHRKDRSLCPVETSMTFIKDNEGNISGSVGAIKDITERKKAEEALQGERDFSNMVIETADVVITGVDLEGKAFLFNRKAEEVTGYSREEVIGNDFVKVLVPEEGRATFAKLIQEIKREGKVINSFDASLNTKNGEERIILSRGTPLKNAEGEIEGILGIGLDVTESRKMEGQLLQSEKLRALGELSGGVAHDFNNVLAAILGRVQLLKIHLTPPIGTEEKIKSMFALKKGLEIIEKASLDGAETVRRIQEFSRKRADDKDFTQVDMNELLDNALEFTRIRWKNDAESKGIKIRIKKELSPLTPILGSPSELREVFTNLINNAIDAMPQGGEIRINSLMDYNTVVVKIEDTGCGIPKTIKDRIFDPFFTSKGVQSTGLGLSVSYGIINRHRGTTTVDSVEGEGTTFTIKFPIANKTGKENVKKEKVIPINRQQKKASILVIEDEEDIRQLLRDILTGAGHDVEIANGGSEGIEIFKKKKFDLVFTDLGMPVMSGWEVAEKVKSINRKVPVALITGWNIALDSSEMNDSGINLVIQKPFKIEQVLSLVQEGMLLRDQLKAV